MSEKMPKSTAIRMTEDIHINVKAIQYLYSNDFGTPTFIDIIRTLLKEKVEKLKVESKENPELRQDLEEFQKLLKEKLNLDFKLD